VNQSNNHLLLTIFDLDGGGAVFSSSDEMIWDDILLRLLDDRGASSVGLSKAVADLFFTLSDNGMLHVASMSENSSSVSLTMGGVDLRTAMRVFFLEPRVSFDPKSDIVVGLVLFNLQLAVSGILEASLVINY